MLPAVYTHPQLSKSKVNPCPSDTVTCSYPRDWDVKELEARSGALVVKALKNWASSVLRAHWDDMKHTAVLAFLEYKDKPAAYAYVVAKNALKNYIWVHIRGLNGGWRSLEARNYTVSDTPLETDGDMFDSPRDNISWRTQREHSWEAVSRPVEWKVLNYFSDERKATTEEIFKEVLYILAGMSRKNWYPEQLYRAAMIIAMLCNGYTWEDVEAYTDLDYSAVWDIWWHHRKERLSRYIELSPVYQAIVRARGELRVFYFNELTSQQVNDGKRKMVVFPHGIYTITYKQRSHKRYLEASLQKGRRIDGRPTVRAVSLGRVGNMKKDNLFDATHRLEKKFKEIGDVPGSLGQIAQSRQVMFSRQRAVA